MERNTMTIKFNGKDVEIGTIVGFVDRYSESNFVNKIFIASEEKYEEVFNNNIWQAWFNDLVASDAGIDDIPGTAEQFNMLDGGFVLEIVMYEEDNEERSVQYIVPDEGKVDLDKIQEIFDTGKVENLIEYMNSLGYADNLTNEDWGA